MRLAETVTFGGSGLDRAAQLRKDPGLAQRAQEDGAATIVLWRGKVLMVEDADTGSLRLVRLPGDSPLLRHDAGDPMFLGIVEAGLVFARDISTWEPIEQVDEAQIGGFVDRSVQSHPDAPEGSGFYELRTIMTHLTAEDAELAATARALFSWHRSHGFCARCGTKSVVAEAGWQRVCPNCGAHHFPRTDPVVIMLITDGDRVLVGRSPGWPERMYSLLAGFVEPGETIEAAVRREVFEESGVVVGPVTYMASQPWPYPASLMFGCHGLATKTDIQIDPVEIEDAIWLTRSDMLQVFAGEHPDVATPRRGAIAHFLLENWLADRLD